MRQFGASNSALCGIHQLGKRIGRVLVRITRRATATLPSRRPHRPSRAAPAVAGATIRRICDLQREQQRHLRQPRRRRCVESRPSRRSAPAARCRATRHRRALVPFSRCASATSAASSNGSRSISLITFDSRSRPAAPVEADRSSTMALARLASMPRRREFTARERDTGQPLPPHMKFANAPAKASARATTTMRSGGSDGDGSAQAISRAGSIESPLAGIDHRHALAQIDPRAQCGDARLAFADPSIAAGADSHAPAALRPSACGSATATGTGCRSRRRRDRRHRDGRLS